MVSGDVPRYTKEVLRKKCTIFFRDFNSGANIQRLLQLSTNSLIRVLPEAEKLEFVKTSVAWIQGQDIIDSCFILNFGYEGLLPWPQVRI